MKGISGIKSSKIVVIGPVTKYCMNNLTHCVFYFQGLCVALLFCFCNGEVNIYIFHHIITIINTIVCYFLESLLFAKEWMVVKNVVCLFKYSDRIQ